MADDEPGLLGNLPRSRPGTRSDKRSAADPAELASDAEKTRAASGARSKPAPKRSQAAKPGTKRAASPRKASAKGAAASKAGSKAKPVPVTVAEPERPREKSREEKAGPLSSAAKVAGTGLRVAEGVTREVLRRLPRP